MHMQNQLFCSLFFPECCRTKIPSGVLLNSKWVSVSMSKRGKVRLKSLIPFLSVCVCVCMDGLESLAYSIISSKPGQGEKTQTIKQDSKEEIKGRVTSQNVFEFMWVELCSSCSRF
ncbi:hypothetical protein AMECASPLE_006051 [Ameca splendens]|uniref:Uncharacterized protein n=1 Tax=Ameca splendens TaxID=208324 RepID=A0ABV0YA97_9TELE